MKSLITFMAILLLNSFVMAQVIVSGSMGSDGNYTSFTNAGGAFSAINATPQSAADILVTITGDLTTESGNFGLNAGSWNSLSIVPVGTRTVSGTASPGLITLNGANNVTIDGLNSGGNSLTFSNAATGTASTLKFVNDASNNFIQNCTLLGSASITGSGVVLFSTGITTGNDGNTINLCNIGPAGSNLPLNGVYSAGTSTAINNSGNALEANNIYDFFSATLATAGILLTNTGNSAWIITNNKIYQSANRIFTSGNTHSGISIGGGSAYTISGNTIGFSNPSGSGTMNLVGNSNGYSGIFPAAFSMSGSANATRFIAISCAFTAGGIVSNIQGNTVAGIALLTSSGASTTNGIFCGINITSGNVNIGTTTGNTVGSATATSSLYACTSNGNGVVVGIYANSANTICIQNNTIAGIDAVGTTASLSGSFTGIDVAGSGTFTISSNYIGNSLADNIRCGYTLSGTKLSNAGILTSTIGTASSLLGIRSTSGGANLNISTNTFRGWASSSTAGATLTGIISSGTNTSSVTINGNSLGTASRGWMRYAFPNAGTLTGINLSGSAAATDHSVQYNNFQGIVYSAGGTGSHTYITTTAGTAANDLMTISNNTFTNLNASTSGDITFFSLNYNISNSGTQTLSNNAIVTAFNKGLAGGNIRIVRTNAVSAAGAVINHIDNNFAGITATGTTNITGWLSIDNGSANRNYNGNIMNNWTTGSGDILAMSIEYNGPNIDTGITITGNLISGLTTAGNVTAIRTAASTVNITSNTIHTLSGITSLSGIVNGIEISSGTTINIDKNKIYNLSNEGNFTTPSGVNGLLVNDGISVRACNNLIGSLYCPNANSTDAVRGISILSTTPSSECKIYYNTIYLNATSAGNNFGSSGIYHTASTIPSTAALDLRNNIIVNNSTSSGNGVAVVYRRSAGTSGMLANYALTSNNNLFFAASPGSMIYEDGTSNAASLSIYKTAVFTAGTISPRDSSSVSENPVFLSLDGADTNFLHLDPAVVSLCESGAVNIPGLDCDFDGDIRQGNLGYLGNSSSSPDMGADEGNFMTIPANTITLSGNIKYYSPANTNLAGITVRLQQNGADVATATTNALGNYLFTGVSPGNYAMILSSLAQSGGVNSSDALQVAYYRVYSPWTGNPVAPIEKVRLYAGDVMTNQSLASNDASRILYYYVNDGIPAWSPRALWTFWPRNEMISANPASGGNSLMVISIDITSSTTRDFWALCTGDFNCDFNVSGAKDAQAKLHLRTENNRKVQAGKDIELPVYAVNSMNISSISMILNFPADRLDLKDVILNNSAGSPVMYKVSGNEVRIGWYSLTPVIVEAGEALFTLKLRISGAASENEVISFSLTDDPLNEMTGADYKQIKNANLSTDRLIISLAETVPSIGSNLKISCLPNPFSDKLSLSYTLPEEGNVILEVYNMLGEKVKSLIHETQRAGDHALSLDAREWVPGIYTLKLQYKSQTQSRSRAVKVVRR